MIAFLTCVGSEARLCLCSADFSIASLRDLAYWTIAFNWESVRTHSKSSSIRISLDDTTLQSFNCCEEKSKIGILVTLILIEYILYQDLGLQSMIFKQNTKQDLTVIIA